MDGSNLNERKYGSVKEAINSYRAQILEKNPTMKKLQRNYPENNTLLQKPFTKTRELHQAKRSTNQLNESRRFAESITAEAKSELSAAKKTVKDLTQRIEESNSRAKRDLEKLRTDKREEGECNSENSRCAKVLKELELIKQELSKLRLDMASVLEEKRRAEKETESSSSKTESYLSSVEALNKEIEEINEEHVLVELARIEAIKEYEEIEAQRREMAEKYSAEIEETRKKKQNMVREIEAEKEMELKLAITISDTNVLESELKQAKEMDKRHERNEILQEEDEEASDSLLESIKKELEATKKELDSVKQESFQFMASMDLVRNEFRHVKNETAQARKKEEKTEMIIQNLNSKLLRAKAKLEETSAAEDKAKLMASNLSVTLQQLKSEAETIRNERSLISEETAIIKAEVQKTETEIDLAEERLQAAIQELQAVKSTEAEALENLKGRIEKTIRNRASASQPSSTITISKFEYEYLTGHAAGAKEIADKKVAAAEAWVEALKASEKEIQIKSELLRREIREQRMEEERDVHQIEGSMNADEVVEDDFEKWRQGVQPEKLKNRSIKTTPIRIGKAQRSSSLMIRATPRTKSSTVKRKKKVMPNLSKLFSGKSSERDM